MVIRVNKTKNFTVMSNFHLKDKRLSLKAKGLLSMMLALSDDWNYSIAGLVAISKENETAIKSTLHELKQYGYLIITKKMPNETKSGRIEYEYDIYEQPQEKQEVEKQGIENLPLELLHVENHGQLNTNKSNTKEVNTNNKKLNNNTAQASGIIEKEFEELWSLYPRKVGKSNALKTYQTVRKKNPDIYATILESLKAFNEYNKRNKVDMQYIAHGSTWFNQRRWEDDYTGGEANGSSSGDTEKERTTQTGYKLRKDLFL